MQKAMKVMKPETVNSCWQKLYQDVVYDFTGFIAQPIKKIIKEVMDMAKKVGGCKGFKVCVLEKFKS